MTKYFILLIVILGSIALCSTSADEPMPGGQATPVLTSAGSKGKTSQETIHRLNKEEKDGRNVCAVKKETGKKQPACHQGSAEKKSQFPKVMIHAFPYKQTVTTVKQPTLRMSPDC